MVCAVGAFHDSPWHYFSQIQLGPFSILVPVGLADDFRLMVDISRLPRTTSGMYSILEDEDLSAKRRHLRLLMELTEVSSPDV